MSVLRSRQVQRVLLVVALALVTWLVLGDAVTGGLGRTPTAVTTSDRGPAPTKTSLEATTDRASGLPWVNVGDLPAEARRTLALIRAGGPYPYPRNDDQTFLNREGVLPSRPRGYYKEFTVETPGSADRGPRRIVTGAGGEKYWTDDHYRSFSRIREVP